MEAALPEKEDVKKFAQKESCECTKLPSRNDQAQSPAERRSHLFTKKVILEINVWEKSILSPLGGRRCVLFCSLVKAPYIES